MTSSLSLTLFIIWASTIPLFTEAFPNEDPNGVYADGTDGMGSLSSIEEKRGGTVYSEEFSIYSCSLLPLFSKCDKKRGLLPYIPYGLVHTLIKIGNTCYDWGKESKAMRTRCSDDCCYEMAKRRYRGYTRCANRVHEFENAWEDEIGSYGAWSNNCQRYTNSMKDFLLNCYRDAYDAIP